MSIIFGLLLISFQTTSACNWNQICGFTPSPSTLLLFQNFENLYGKATCLVDRNQTNEDCAERTAQGYAWDRVGKFVAIVYCTIPDKLYIATSVEASHTLTTPYISSLLPQIKPHMTSGQYDSGLAVFLNRSIEDYDALTHPAKDNTNLVVIIVFSTLGGIFVLGLVGCGVYECCAEKGDQGPLVGGSGGSSGGSGVDSYSTAVGAVVYAGGYSAGAQPATTVEVAELVYETKHCL